MVKFGLDGWSTTSFEEAVQDALKSTTDSQPVEWDIRLRVESGGFVGRPQYKAYLQRVLDVPTESGKEGESRNG